MPLDDIYKDLLSIFRDLFDDENIMLSPDMTADDIDGWDSLTHINLIVVIEAHFGIKFKTAEIEAMHNVGHLATAIEKKLA
jgi:acyl carrier protein